MKNATYRDWRFNRPMRKNRFSLDQTTALGGLTLALLAYIVYYFIYPMIVKGIL